MHFIRIPAPEGAVLVNVSQIIRIHLQTESATIVMVDGANVEVKGKSAAELEHLLTSSGMVPYGVN